jgi:hypothetical protein
VIHLDLAGEGVIGLTVIEHPEFFLTVPSADAAAAPVSVRIVRSTHFGGLRASEVWG